MNDFSKTGDVLTYTEDRGGLIRLNRSKALHALTRPMCEAISAALEIWRDDPEVQVVAIDHFHGRGFCAGGDIRMIANSAMTDGAEARAFFDAEYRMNHQLFTYAKPTAAFIDGVVMGGGVGLSLPCRYRVVTENARFAMPETAIGLFPDVGGGWYLSRLPGRIGQYLALTGARLDGAEMMALGLATHYVPSYDIAEAKRFVGEDPTSIPVILSTYSAPPPEAAILSRREAIDRLFASDVLEDILAALEDEDDDWAREQLTILRQRSPLSCKVSLKLLLDARTMPTFEDEMRQEYAVATHIVQRPDLIEGVRAVIVDKDHAPRWDPATPEEVSGHMIDRIFAPLGADDEWNP